MMIKNKRKEKKELSAAESKFGVILEHMDSNFKLVLEGHAALEKELKDFKHEMRNEIRTISFKLSVITSKIDDLEARLNRFEDENKSEHKTIFEYLTRIDGELAEIKNKLDRKVDLERVAVLEKRVAALSAKARS